MTEPKKTPRKPGAGLGPPPMNGRPKRSQHLIDDISYSADWIVCICAWKGAVDAFQPHRKEMEPPVPGRRH